MKRRAPLTIVRPGWHLPERAATDEGRYLDRRAFVRAWAAAGLVGVAGTAALLGCDGGDPGATSPRGDGGAPADLGPPPTGETWAQAHAGLYPVGRNPRYTVTRAITDEAKATGYNNFYEFSSSKTYVAEKVKLDRFTTRPWTVRIEGLVEKPLTLDFDKLVRQMPLEERVYRFRCVEAWAMTVPWSGFELSELVALAKPLSSARYIAFQTAARPREMTGIPGCPECPWPYHEGLTLAEANNELAFVATGIYGKPLPRQNGAPLRMVLPWKYGFKGAKSIERIVFTDKQPPTFWNTIAPREYDFWANVDPDKPHPRWSQKREKLIGSGNYVDTLKYNGYGVWVGDLYGEGK